MRAHASQGRLRLQECYGAMSQGVSELLALISLLGAIWLLGALFIKLGDQAHRRRVSAMAKRRAQLSRTAMGRRFS